MTYVILKKKKKPVSGSYHHTFSENKTGEYDGDAVHCTGCNGYKNSVEPVTCHHRPFWGIELDRNPGYRCWLVSKEKGMRKKGGREGGYP
jgi:hypothetical protein